MATSTEIKYSETTHKFTVAHDPDHVVEYQSWAMAEEAVKQYEVGRAKLDMQGGPTVYLLDASGARYKVRGAHFGTAKILLDPAKRGGAGILYVDHPAVSALLRERAPLVERLDALNAKLRLFEMPDTLARYDPMRADLPALWQAWRAKARQIVADADAGAATPVTDASEAAEPNYRTPAVEKA